MHRGRQKGALLSQLQIWEAGANNKEQLTITRKAFQSADTCLIIFSARTKSVKMLWLLNEAIMERFWKEVDQKKSLGPQHDHGQLH